jgi:hypothetical protein
MPGRMDADAAHAGQINHQAALAHSDARGVVVTVDTDTSTS